MGHSALVVPNYGVTHDPRQHVVSRSVGQRVDVREVGTTEGLLRFPAAQGLTHLQVRRFAGCPICAEHLRPFTRRRAELDAAGITEFVVFKSTEVEVRAHESHLGLPAVGDAEARWYAEFEVTSNVRSLLHPAALATFVRSVVRHRSLLGSLSVGDHLGLPADFLLDPDGEILDCCYGRNAADGWSVDTVLQRGATLVPDGGRV